jgi:hypothetical protein
MMKPFAYTPLKAALAAALLAPLSSWAGETSPSLPEVIVESAQNVIVAMSDGIARRAETMIFGDGQNAFASGMFTQMGAGRRVVGAPYSAEIITERVQTLPDGNQITRKQSQMIYRDGEGRTRQERLDGDGKSTVVISDPVAKTRHVLSPGRRTAYQLPVVDVDGMLSKLRAEAGQASEKAIKGLKDGKGEISVRINDGEARVKSFTLSAGGQLRVSDSDGKSAPTEKRIEIAELFRFDGADGIGVALRESLSALSPLIGGDGAIRLRSEAGASTSKSLGSRDFGGVRADGTLATRTIAPGSIGNKAAINITSESWHAPDLQITLYSKHSDPRYGDTIYRVNNLQRGEPSADLFKVPADYATRGAAKNRSEVK